MTHSANLRLTSVGTYAPRQTSTHPPSYTTSRYKSQQLHPDVQHATLSFSSPLPCVPNTPPIAILGAGPSGLLLARLLSRAHIPCTVFERDATPHESTSRSGTLDIRAGSGQRALREAGLLEEFRRVARHDVRTVLADGQGRVYVRSGEGGEGDGDRPEIDRKDLRRLILESIPAERVRWGKKVASVRRDSDGSMAVCFADGNVATGFRLVVGADGAWSKARSLVTPTTPSYTGITYLTSTITPGNPIYASATALAGPGNYIAFAAGAQLVVCKLGDGGYYVGVGLRLPEDWTARNEALLKDGPALGRWLGDEVLVGWAEANKELVREADGEWFVWPLYGMPAEALGWETVPGVALVGDAAHLSPPFIGEGVNNALVDSLQLAQQIVAHGVDGVDRAVAEYETRMFPRGRDIMVRSKASGELWFAEDAPRGWLKAFAGVEYP